MVIGSEETDGSAVIGTTAFCLDGFNYEIDLSIADAAALRSLLACYIADRRRTDRTDAAVVSTAKKPARGVAGQRTTSRIRFWAVDSGFQIASHGPLPDKISRPDTRPTRTGERGTVSTVAAITAESKAARIENQDLPTR